MNFSWNKRVLASSFAAVTMATSLNAIPRGPCDQPIEEVCCEMPKPGPFAFAFPTDLGINCPNDFYVHVDGLAMVAKEDGLDFAMTDSTSGLAGVAAAPLTGGDIVGFSEDNSSSWDYNPGARFGLGFYLDHDAWNIDFNWTWLNITNYKHGNASSPGEVLIPLWVLGTGTPSTTPNLFGTRSSAVWKASYNTLDFSLGKPYHVSRYVIFNPYFGVRVGWIDQHYSVDYGGFAGESRTIFHGHRNNFKGVGTRIGFNTDWILGKGWCLFANVSGALMASKFEVHQELTFPSPGTDNVDLNFSTYKNVPCVDMALGIAWSRYFDKNKYRVALKAAYEFMEWWDQLNFRKFYSSAPGYASDVVPRGNLTLNGFSLRLQLDI